MNWWRCSRRQFLWTGVGLLAAGCAPAPRITISRPTPTWPSSAQRPTPTGPGEPDPLLPPTPAPSPSRADSLPVLGRHTWARGQPIPGRLNPMGVIDRITVHHEGWTVVDFSDEASTKARLDAIRRSHLDRGFGDIGYHYIIDRSGRMWEGRPLRYQGAHVHEHNPHNLGLMVLGNFDLQRPTDAQMITLRQALSQCCRQYRVPIGRIFTHRELNPTTCPGRALQAPMVSLRGSNVLG